MTAPGRCSRRTPKMVGNIPPEPTAMGVMSNLFVSHSLEVTPCCAGPAPMIIEAQFGLLTVGKTPRARMVQAPSAMSRRMLGALAFCTPSGLMPSQPMMTTYLTPPTAPDAGRTMALQAKAARQAAAMQLRRRGEIMDFERLN